MDTSGKRKEASSGETSPSKKVKKDGDVNFGTFKGAIVGRQHCEGKLTDGETVSFVRGPDVENVLRIDNAAGEKVGCLSRDLAFPLGSIMDKKLATLHGVIPSGAEKPNGVPLDITLWGLPENKEKALAIMEKYKHQPQTDDSPMKEPKKAPAKAPSGEKDADEEALDIEYTPLSEALKIQGVKGKITQIGAAKSFKFTKTREVLIEDGSTKAAAKVLLSGDIAKEFSYEVGDTIGVTGVFHRHGEEGLATSNSSRCVKIGSDADDLDIEYAPISDVLKVEGVKGKILQVSGVKAFRFIKIREVLIQDGSTKGAVKLSLYGDQAKNFSKEVGDTIGISDVYHKQGQEGLCASNTSRFFKIE